MECLIAKKSKRGANKVLLLLLSQMSVAVSVRRIGFHGRGSGTVNEKENLKLKEKANNFFFYLPLKEKNIY